MFISIFLPLCPFSSWDFPVLLVGELIYFDVHIHILLGTNIDVLQMSLMMDMRSIFLPMTLRFCLGRPTLFKTASPSQHVTSLGLKYWGKMIDDVKEEIPSYPLSSLLYALWSSGVPSIKSPPLIHYLPFGVVTIQVHASIWSCV